MAKKKTAKQMREEALAAKKANISAREDERKKKTKEELTKQESERKNREEQKKKDVIMKRFKLDSETRSAQRKNDRKSLAKAAGLKSTFAVGNELYMTSFGSGNDAVLEKKIADKQVTLLTDDAEIFSVDEKTITEMTVPIKSNRIASLTSQADNPLYRKESETNVRPDKLMLKDTLERLYFGKTFDDTLHIQLIYNILDIEKIITVHSVNTIYTLNNLLGAKDVDKDDIIKSLSFQKTCNEFCQKEKNVNLLDNFHRLNTLGYYGNVFFKKSKKRSKREVYDILAVIASIRQWCIHCEEDKRSWIYNAESVLKEEFTEIIDDIYKDAVDKINIGFIKENKVNISILSEILNMKSEKDFDELVRHYYRFIVKKNQKLLGFSLKKLREYMLEDHELKTNKEYDSVRSKLYKLIDFIILYGYTHKDEEKERAQELICQLRASLSEDSKEDLYKKESDRLWTKYEEIIMTGIVPNIKGSVIKELKSDTTLDDKSIDGIVEKETENITYFSKIMYLLAQFIDGKEVNDLTTTLINKFDNIRSIIETAEAIGVDCTFTEEYSFFKDSSTVVGEMQIIKNLSGMNGFDSAAKFQMYCDAMEILGVNEDITDENKRQRINEILCIGADGNMIKDYRGNKKSGFRNFIASNVIESSRFRYLVKYCNPKKIRKIANNENIIKFVLGRIPDTQIERYYYSCNPELKRAAYPGHDAAINDLIRIISEMKFEDFNDVKQNANVSDESSNDAVIKQKYQTIISLYLTVCYLLIKNLVNINARYVMAFHSLERDARLYGVFDSEDDYKNKLSNDYSVLTKMILADGPENAKNLHLRSKKWNAITRKNLENYDKNAELNFRNAVAHLNPIRNADIFIDDIREIGSYYDIYHYIIQKGVIKRLKEKNSVLQNPVGQYDVLINTYHTYCKDFVKALCVPFGYNVVRFKALSIYEMFDRNYRNENKAEEERSCLV